MAGDWIKIRKCLPNDPRIIRMASALHADRFRTLGGTLSAWCLFDEHTASGRLDGYTPSLLDDVLGFPGLAGAMELVGWLVAGDGFLLAPRFEKHNGKTAKRRCSENERKRSARNADRKRTESGPEKRREEKSSTLHTARAKDMEEIRNAYPRRTHVREALQEIDQAIQRNGNAEDIHNGTVAIAKAVESWTDAERLQFLKAPPAFFAGDHWKDDPAYWASKAPARKESHGRKPMQKLDLGGRQPAGILNLES